MVTKHLQVMLSTSVYAFSTKLAEPLDIFDVLPQPPGRKIIVYWSLLKYPRNYQPFRSFDPLDKSYFLV